MESLSSPGSRKPGERGNIEDREELIFLLSDAAALEHVIMCEYLFAAFSCLSAYRSLNAAWFQKATCNHSGCRIG